VSIIKPAQKHKYNTKTETVNWRSKNYVAGERQYKWRTGTKIL